MKKIGCLTFHSSYNYGSALQAYALQTVFCKLTGEVEYKIINYRTLTQKKLYENCFEKNNFKSLYQRMFLLGKKKQIYKKENLFESFFSKELMLTKEVSNAYDLKNVSLDFDSFIVGSDQIWNLYAKDFDWVYFLEFTGSSNKYAYSVSCGPIMKQIPLMYIERITSDLNSFRMLSVRDERSYSLFSSIVSNKDISINIDPTLLLEKGDWLKLIQDADITVPKEKYILFYDLSRDKKNWKLAKKCAKKMGLKLLITSVPFPRTIPEIFGTLQKFDVGPKEFLLLLLKSEFVITSSFHGTIFSFLFRKRFATIVRDGDNRLSYLMDHFDLRSHCLDETNIDAFDSELFCETSRNSTCILEEERKRGISYLTSMIERIKYE